MQEEGGWRAQPLVRHSNRRYRRSRPRHEPTAPMAGSSRNRFLRAAMLRQLAACADVELVAPDEALETERDPDKVEISLKSGRI